MPNDFYTPEHLAMLRDQLQQANATGLPWVIEGARQAWQYARDAGADLPFDEAGNDVAGSAGSSGLLPLLPPSVANNDAATQQAIAQGQSSGAYQPAPDAPAGNDFYTPDRLALLRDQITQANATGLPWMAQGAQQAWDYAQQNGGNLPFDATGASTGNVQLPPVPDSVTQNDAAVAAAIQQAQSQGVYEPPAPTPPVPAPNVGGGSGAPPVTPDASTSAPPSLATDPAYLAFQRALGLERSTAETNTQGQVDSVNQGVALRLPQIADQAAYGRERLSGGYEARGLLRSGQHETALGRARQAEANQTAGVQSDAANRIAALRQGLAQQETAFDTRGAEAALSASQRQQDLASQQAQQQTYQQQVAAQLAEQRRANDTFATQQADLFRQYGYTTPGAAPAAAAASSGNPSRAATPANPLAGIVGIVPAEGDPDYERRMAALRAQIGV